MSACPSCRAELPGGARFCPSCGTRLEASGPEATERKIVTTLFADLVGFTALGERHDPEDIDAALRGFYGLARTIVERFGGVVEKFIGDAVVGLFGVPAAHEDDAERAVRAALELVAHLHELPPVGGERLQVRCAVNTGPSLVRLNARPETGEGVLIGDAVNTCARLLGEAPVMGVVAGEMTQRLSARAIAYEGLPAVAAKGKTHPIRRWLARGPVGRRGIDPREPETEMVGREVELAILLGLLDKSVAQGIPRFALVQGEAGIGKTRLVREMFRVVDERRDFICTWRQGRCPPYGEGLAFWALSEIFSDHAGILQSDGPEMTEQKLRSAFGGADDAEWILARLRPLVGLPAAPSEREDSFAAWLRAIADIAEVRPTILVFEDLHSASDATLTFLHYLVEQARDIPLLVLMTARPEPRATPSWLLDERSVMRIKLNALDTGECSKLAKTLAGPASPPEIVDSAVARCGGNPLFTTEYIRYAVDLCASGGRPTEEVGTIVPDSLSSLISARLDALPPEEKRLISDAAVVGQVFWPGALEALREDQSRQDQDSALEGLERRGLISALPSSSVARQTEFTFTHGLIRDVAYDRLTRLAKARRHAAIAEWIDASVEARMHLVGVLAHHAVCSFDLAQAAHDDDLAGRLQAPAVIALEAAGHAALGYDVGSAQDYFAHAVEVAADSKELDARLLVSWAEVLMLCGRHAEADLTLERALGLPDIHSDSAVRARALVARATSARFLGHDSTPMLSEALKLADQAPSSPAMVEVLVQCGREAIAGLSDSSAKHVQAIAVLEKAMNLARTLSLPAPPLALTLTGYLASRRGDATGRRLCEEAVREARSQGRESICAYCELGLAEIVAMEEGPGAALPLYDAAARTAERHGEHETRVGALAKKVVFLCLAGAWDEAVAKARDLVIQFKESSDIFDLVEAVALLVLIQGRRDEIDASSSDMAWLLGHCEASPGAVGLPAFIAPASVLARRGETARARELINGWLTVGPPDVTGQTEHICEGARIAVSVGALDLARRELESLTMGWPIVQHSAQSIRALIAASDGDHEDAAKRYADAADRWHSFGMPYEEAHALVGLGRAKIRLGDARAGVSVFNNGIAIFESLGAKADVDAARATLRLARAQR